MFNIGKEYVRRLRSNKNQLYRDLKPKERICRIITEHIQPNINSNDFKFIKSRMQLERSVGDFKQAVWFRTSSNNYRDEVVKFEVHLIVENGEYTKHCIEKYDYQKSNFTNIHVEYLDLWDKEFCDGWYSLQLDDNNKIVQKIAENISHCYITYLDTNSGYESSLTYRFKEFKSLNYFALLLIPDILILSKMINDKEVLDEVLKSYEEWKLTEKGKKVILEGADILNTIERIIKLL